MDATLRQKLLSRGHSGMVLGLGRMEVALAALGHPERGLRAFHVAGTNGKGSVSAMLRTICEAEGYRVGLYTSPHLSQFRERIQAEGGPISEELFDASLRRVFRDGPEELTFFETLTLAAFVAFSELALDVAVLEVGLGGRLDATNVIERPIATGVVSLPEGRPGDALEHANYLGDSIEALAYEKASIAKPGRPMVLGTMPPSARRVAEETAQDRGASVTVSASEFDLGGLDLEPGLAGQHQLANAAVAATMATVGRDLLPISSGSIARGIRETRWPGRLETIVYREREFVIDSAHNIDGVRALVRALEERGFSAGTLIFGALRDKAYEPMLRLLLPFAAHRIYGLPEGRAPATHEALREIAPGEAATDAADAVRRACEGPPSPVLVTGSIYLVGAVRAELLGLRRDPVLGL